MVESPQHLGALCDLDRELRVEPVQFLVGLFQLGGQAPLGGDQTALFEGVVDRLQQYFRPHRLVQKAEDLSLMEGGDHNVEIGASRQHERHGIRRRFPHPPQQFHPVHLRHVVIRQDDCERPVAGDGGQRLPTAHRRMDLEFLAQLALQSVQDIGLIVDAEDGLAVHRRSSASHCLVARCLGQLAPGVDAVGDPDALEVFQIQGMAEMAAGAIGRFRQQGDGGVDRADAAESAVAEHTGGMLQGHRLDDAGGQVP